MRDDEKAPAVGGTTPEASAHGMAGSFARDDSTTNQEKPQGRSFDFLISLLGHGEGNAISQEQLRALLGFGSVRATRQIVEDARRAGEIVLSSARGYFRPSEDPAEAEIELERYLHLQAERLRTNRASVASARIALARLTHRNQLELEEAITDG